MIYAGMLYAIGAMLALLCAAIGFFIGAIVVNSFVWLVAMRYQKRHFARYGRTDHWEVEPPKWLRKRWEKKADG